METGDGIRVVRVQLLSEASHFTTLQLCWSGFGSRVRCFGCAVERIADCTQLCVSNLVVIGIEIAIAVKIAGVEVVAIFARFVWLGDVANNQIAQ